MGWFSKNPSQTSTSSNSNLNNGSIYTSNSGSNHGSASYSSSQQSPSPYTAPSRPLPNLDPKKFMLPQHTDWESSQLTGERERDRDRGERSERGDRDRDSRGGLSPALGFPLPNISFHNQSQSQGTPVALPPAPVEPSLADKPIYAQTGVDNGAGFRRISREGSAGSGSFGGPREGEKSGRERVGRPLPLPTDAERPLTSSWTSATSAASLWGTESGDAFFGERGETGLSGFRGPRSAVWETGEKEGDGGRDAVERERERGIERVNSPAGSIVSPGGSNPGLSPGGMSHRVGERGERWSERGERERERGSWMGRAGAIGNNGGGAYSPEGSPVGARTSVRDRGEREERERGDKGGSSLQRGGSGGVGNALMVHSPSGPSTLGGGERGQREKAYEKEREKGGPQSPWHGSRVSPEGSPGMSPITSGRRPLHSFSPLVNPNSGHSMVMINRPVPALMNLSNRTAGMMKGERERLAGVSSDKGINHGNGLDHGNSNFRDTNSMDSRNMTAVHHGLVNTMSGNLSPLPLTSSGNFQQNQQQNQQLFGKWPSPGRVGESQMVEGHSTHSQMSNLPRQSQPPISDLQHLSEFHALPLPPPPLSHPLPSDTNPSPNSVFNTSPTSPGSPLPPPLSTVQSSSSTSSFSPSSFSSLSPSLSSSHGHHHQLPPIESTLVTSGRGREGGEAMSGNLGRGGREGGESMPASHHSGELNFPSQNLTVSLNRAPRMGHWKKCEPPLGSGSFGVVYKGFNRESGSLFAVKEVPLHRGNGFQEESLRQLKQEIALMSQLQHPNIVQYLGTDTDSRALYIFLEYMPGGSIHALLQEYGRFSDPVLRMYTRHILQGLCYLHRTKTVHRDIKGANLLVDTNGQVKLADFGMAKHMRKDDYSKSYEKGSSYWMAPEVLVPSEQGYALAVDIWSLGCTVLEMATGRPPWWPLEGIQAMFKIAKSDEVPSLPPDLSPDCRDFVLQCLQRDPGGRPSAQRLLEHPFVRGGGQEGGGEGGGKGAQPAEIRAEIRAMTARVERERDLLRQRPLTPEPSPRGSPSPPPSSESHARLAMQHLTFSHNPEFPRGGGGGGTPPPNSRETCRGQIRPANNSTFISVSSED